MPPWEKYAAPASNGPWAKYGGDKAASKSKVDRDAEARVKNTPGLVRAFSGGASWGAAGDLDALSAMAETAIGNTVKKLQGKPVDYSPGEARTAVKRANVLADAAYAKEHPVIATGTNILGAIAAPGSGAIGKFIGAGATGAAKVARAAGAGALGGGIYGGLSAEEGKRSENALSGAALGSIAGGATQGVLNSLGPKAALDSAARRLSRSGVELTPGQMAGGFGKRVEDAMTSIPITGSAINSARRRGVDSFRRATFDQALAPIGQALPKDIGTGNEAISHAQKAIGGAYDKILPNLTFSFDQKLASDLGDVATRTATLPGERGAQVNRILRDKVLSPLQQQSFDGTAWKKADSELGRLAANYRGSLDADQREVGMVLQDAQSVLRDWMSRSNPNQRPAIEAANNAWANFTRLRDAAASAGANSEGGEFTANQLLRATRQGDKSMAKGATARGEAKMQGWAQDAQGVLPSKINDSGTAIRTMMGAGLYGGASGVMGGPVAAKAIAADLAGAALYTKPVQTLINRIYRATDRKTATQGVQGLRALAKNDPKLLPLVEEIEARLSQAPVAATRQASSAPAN